MANKKNQIKTSAEPLEEAVGDEMTKALSREPSV